MIKHGSVARYANNIAYYDVRGTNTSDVTIIGVQTVFRRAADVVRGLQSTGTRREDL